MEQNKHEYLVRHIAQEMAESTHPGTWDKAKESLIDNFSPAARIAVKHMAEMYKAGYMSNFPDNGEENEKLWQSNCVYEMEDIGLISKK